MTTEPLSEETTFLIDFNLHRVPAALGLDVPPAAAAEMIGATEAQFLSYIEKQKSDVKDTADILLADSSLAMAIDRIPVPKGGLILTLGDSITTYRNSYACLLESMFGRRRPNDEVCFVNAAQSGYTSTHGLETVYTQALELQPDWVSIMFGANDCKHFGGSRSKTLVSLEEYRSNITSMVDAFLAHTKARPILLTPAPVVEDIVNGNPDFYSMRMTWDNDDIRACADSVRELARQHGLKCVDLFGTFGESPDADLYLDGLHPGLAGHRLILAALLDTVADVSTD